MKKMMIWAVIMMTIAITATAGVKGAWPTTSKLPAWPSGQAFSVEEPDTTVYHPAEK